MNSINYNELRRLGKASRSRPIFQCIHVKDNTLYFTNSYLLLVVKNFKQSDGLYNLDTYQSIGGDYPPVENIINSRKNAIEPIWEQSILNGEVIHIYEKNPAEIYYIDRYTINQIEKLIKGYTFNFKDVKIAKRSIVLELENITLISLTKIERISPNVH